MVTGNLDGHGDASTSAATAWCQRDALVATCLGLCDPLPAKGCPRADPPARSLGCPLLHFGPGAPLPGPAPRRGSRSSFCTQIVPKARNKESAVTENVLFIMGANPMSSKAAYSERVVPCSCSLPDGAVRVLPV